MKKRFQFTAFITLEVKDLNNIKEVAPYLQKDLIVVDHRFANTDELFTHIAKLGKQYGYVNDDFLPKIKKRESTYPTGLQLETDGVAIPHTDADTIQKEFIAVVTNPQTEFSRMDDPTQKISANLVFVLGLKQPHAQLSMLQSLMALFQDNKFLQKIEGAKTAQEVMSIFGKD